MHVIVHAQNLSNQTNDSYYSMPNLASALDIFFYSEESAFLDHANKKVLSRDDAEALFKKEHRLTFYNDAFEKVVISLDEIT